MGSQGVLSGRVVWEDVSEAMMQEPRSSEVVGWPWPHPGELSQAGGVKTLRQSRWCAQGEVRRPVKLERSSGDSGPNTAALGRALAVLPGVVGLGQKSAGSDLCFPRSFWLPLGTRSGGVGKHERRSQAN